MSFPLTESTSLSYVQRVPDKTALTNEIRLRMDLAPVRVDYRSNILTLSFEQELTEGQKSSLAAIVASAEQLAAAAAAEAAAGMGNEPTVFTFGPKLITAEEYMLVHAWEYMGRARDSPVCQLRVQAFVSAGPTDDPSSPDFGYDLRWYDVTHNAVMGAASFSNETWSNCVLAVSSSNDVPLEPVFFELHARKKPECQSVALSSLKVLYDAS